jgi:class 3 adenylate cyclase
MKTTNAAATLASVVFLKIQEFARRPVQEQTRLRAQLEAVVAVTAAELAPAGRIVLDAADGAAIVVLADPGGALRLGERALSATAAGLPLCIGINHGAVQIASGGRGAEGLIGDGISVAASVAEFASPTRLLISRSFRDALADAAPGTEAGLFAAGVFTDAGLRTHELFSPDRHAAERRRKRLIAFGAAAVIGIVGAGVAVRVSTGGHPKLLDGVIAKFRISAKDGETYLRSLREKFKL